MRKNLKTGAEEPKNANHGQIEQHRVEGKNGKGTTAPTRSNKGKKAPKSEA